MAWVATAGRMPLSGSVGACDVDAPHQRLAELGADARQHAAAKRVQHAVQEVCRQCKQREGDKRRDAAAGQNPVRYLQHVERARQASTIHASGKDGNAHKRRAAARKRGKDFVARSPNVDDWRRRKHVKKSLCNRSQCFPRTLRHVRPYPRLDCPRSFCGCLATMSERKHMGGSNVRRRKGERNNLPTLRRPEGACAASRSKVEATKRTRS